MEKVSSVTMMRWLQVVQRERANFFVARVKLVCDPGRVLLLSFANVLVLPFATGHLFEFCSGYFFWGLCLGVGGRGPRALGIRRPWGVRVGLYERSVSKLVFLDSV